MSIKSGLLLKSFTLIEMIIVSVIFGIICISTSVLLISAQQSWNRQITQIKMLEADAWSLQRLTMEMRGSRQATFSNDRNGNGIDFDIDTNGDNVMDTTVWYWSPPPGCASGNDNTVFYRGTGPLSINANFCPSVANTSPMNGFFSTSTFNDSAGDGTILVTISNCGHYRNDRFIMYDNANGNGLNFALRTKIRPRNQ